MSENKPNQQEEPYEEISWIKRQFVNCFKGARLVKTLIILACIAIVVQQLTACITKLIIVPVTTYTHFDFNKTILYPSVTFCKEPAYKFDKLLEYGLYSHPRYTSTWINYNFSVDLDQLWTDITYAPNEMFVQYGLNGLMSNVDIVPTIGFVMGTCYTAVPKVLGTHASKSTGYSFTLRHTKEEVTTASGVDPPGYHVYIHYTHEPFTEVEVYNGGLVQTLKVNVGETIDVKLTVDKYVMISDDDDPCTNEKDYSANLCTARNVHNIVADEVGCSGPWMTSDLPRCDNYTDVRNLISSYMNKYLSHNTANCPRFCMSYLYNSFVMDRKDLYVWDDQVNKWYMKTGEAALQTQIYIYFNSMMVSVYEERYNYDWNLFVADLGGSIGFLLGLSVIGLLEVIGKVWDRFIRPYVRLTRIKAASVAGTATADVPSISGFEDKLGKEEDWKKVGQK